MSSGVIQSLWRHPVKGFSPEQLDHVQLLAGDHFPNDRMFAVEDGDSGFDAAAPAHISKMRFTVLARTAKLALFKSKYRDETGVFEVSFDGQETQFFDLKQEDGQVDFATWLTAILGDDFKGPLKLLPAPQQHRFMDHNKAGFISFINSASVAALAKEAGEDISVQRFRGNVVFEATPWLEDSWKPGQRLNIGDAEVEYLAPTVRCKATHANPINGQYDIDTVPLLFQHFKRNTMGFYAKIIRSGALSVGDTLAEIK